MNKILKEDMDLKTIITCGFPGVEVDESELKVTEKALKKEYELYLKNRREDISVLSIMKYHRDFDTLNEIGYLYGGDRILYQGNKYALTKYIHSLDGIGKTAWEHHYFLWIKEV